MGAVISHFSNKSNQDLLKETYVGQQEDNVFTKSGLDPHKLVCAYIWTYKYFWNNFIIQNGGFFEVLWQFSYQHCGKNVQIFRWWLLRSSVQSAWTRRFILFLFKLLTLFSSETLEWKLISTSFEWNISSVSSWSIRKLFSSHFG